MGPKADDRKPAKPSLADVQRDLDDTRAEFAETLDALEQKLNPKVQAKRAREGAARIISRMRK